MEEDVHLIRIELISRDPVKWHAVHLHHTQGAEFVVESLIQESRTHKRLGAILLHLQLPAVQTHISAQFHI